MKVLLTHKVLNDKITKYFLLKYIAFVVIYALKDIEIVNRVLYDVLAKVVNI